VGGRGGAGARGLALGLLGLAALACLAALARFACFAQLALASFLLAGDLRAALFFGGVFGLAVLGALAQAFGQRGVAVLLLRGLR
jgi:lipoprotein